MAVKQRFIDPNIKRKNNLVNAHLSRHPADKDIPVFSLIEFNLSGLCNRSCVFCPRADKKAFPNINKGISIKLYEGVMKDLSAIDFDGTILYSAFSEPFLYKDLEKLITISRSYCPNAGIEIVTNGDMVTEEKVVRLFKAGLTTLAVSMYDGPEQMERFKKMKVSLGLDDSQIVLRVRWLGPEEHFGITLSNRAGAVNIGKIGVNTLREPLAQACYYPFYQTFIDYDGAVLLCAHDWSRRLIVGNVNEDSILNIWNNGAIKKVRMNLLQDDRRFQPCSVCDVQGILVGKDHFQRWGEYYG